MNFIFNSLFADGLFVLARVMGGLLNKESAINGV